MRLLGDRPLALSCIVLAATSFVCVSLNLFICTLLSLLLFLLSLFFLALYLFRKRRGLFLSFLCVLMAFLATASSAIFFHARVRAQEALIGKSVVMEGTVLSSEVSFYRTTETLLALHSIDGVPCYDTVKLRADFVRETAAGEILRVRVLCEPFEVSEAYNERSRALSEGIFGLGRISSVEDCETLEASALSFQSHLLRLRTKLSEDLRTLIGGEEGNLSAAFLLGDRSTLSAHTVLSFRRVGVSHFLALSGLHVSIIIAFLELLLKRLSCPRTVRALAVILLSLFYLLLTGCAPSTVRAVVMCCILMLSYIGRASYDSFTALCAVLAGIVFVTPWAVNDLGMWMSFLAAGSIIAFYPILSQILDRVRNSGAFGKLGVKLLVFVLTPIFVGIAANIALLPLQGFVFGEISLLSIPATLLLSYPLTAVLILSLLCLCGLPAVSLCRFAASLILDSVSALSSLEGIVLPANDMLSSVFLALLSISLLSVLFFKFKKRVIPLVIPVLLSVLLLPASFLVTQITYSHVEAEYISTDRGGEALLLTQKGKCVAVDLSAGNTSAAYTIANLASKSRCTEIESLIFPSYANGDRYFLSALSSTVLIRSIRLPVPQNGQEAALAELITAEAASRGISVSFDLENLGIPALENALIFEQRPNASSLHPVLFSVTCHGERLTYANTDFAKSGAVARSYTALLDDTEVLIVGGGDSGKSRFFSEFRDLKRLMLRNELLRSAFYEHQISHCLDWNGRKYRFDESFFSVSKRGFFHILLLIRFVYFSEGRLLLYDYSEHFTAHCGTRRRQTADRCRKISCGAWISGIGLGNRKRV